MCVRKWGWGVGIGGGKKRDEGNAEKDRDEGGAKTNGNWCQKRENKKEIERK